MELRNRHIVVTGGTSGVGLELVRLLVAENRVTVVGRTSPRSARLREEFLSVGFITADLLEAGAARAVVAALAEDEVVDGLINCAAIQCTPHFNDPDFDPASIPREIATNLTAPCELTAALLPRLLAAPEAFILNVNSALALVPKPDSAVYCATKAALNAFSLSLRAQLQCTSVRILQAFLPLVDTAMTAGRGTGKLPADRVARDILAGIERAVEDNDIGKVALLRKLHRFLPGIARKIVARG